MKKEETIKNTSDDYKRLKYRYEKLQDIGRVGNWEYDIETQYFWGSDGAKRLYGFDPESGSFTTDEVESCIVERERVHQAIVDLIEKDKPYNLEFEIKPIGSETSRYIKSIAEVVERKDGKAKRVMGVVIDVTENKQMEARVIENEKRLRDVLDSTPFPVAIVDSNNKILYWSRSATEMFGHSPNTAEDWYDVAYPDKKYRAEANERWQKKLEEKKGTSGPIYTGEYKVSCKDGKTRVCAIYANFIEDNLVVTLNDITERKEYENKLKEQSVMTQKIVNLVPIRIFWKDKNLVYLGCNQAFANDAGKKSPDELIGKDDYQMGWKEEAEAYREDDMEVIKSGEEKINFIEPQTTPEGKKIWLQTSKIPLRDYKGEITGVLGTYTDITVLKNYEKDMEDKNKTLKSLNAVTTGRELKMIELKKRIEELEKKLEEKKA